MKLFFDKNPILSSLKTFFQEPDVKIEVGILKIKGKSICAEPRIICAYYLAHGNLLVREKELAAPIL